MKRLLLALTLVTVFILSGCNKQDQTLEEKLDTENEIIIEDTKEYLKNIFTGEDIEQEKIPFFVIIENSKMARPHSGLSSADIVFETLVEGGITRYLALFSKDVEKIGPVRSTRPYIQDITVAFDIPFAHCGGSNQAIDLIKRKNLKSINEMYNSSYFFRSKDRKAPHNLYTSSDKLRDYISKNGYTNRYNFNMNFDESIDTSLESASIIKIIPSKYTYSEFRYEDGKYLRFQDGKEDIDILNNKQINVSNVLVLFTDIKDLNNESKHVDVRILGRGNGLLFKGGKVEKVTWVKERETDHFDIRNEKGLRVNLLKGNSWIYIIDNKSQVIY
ncbi:Protein of unknown function [Alkalithermobacter thermoalcaliphilus JW-YL-7 = DSM 7308]|uniref:Lipoprotein YerB n=1 Tax=Alkalithermobacter thermoalcaliphilus JW-YL-7 = DSM 7308 TaxID=1121328 RepID=A0A150FTR3_CLOPD|nr:Protein of unknown function DUF3048 [[Clostridium] paradoxum JW-YL-7 = DSM 7308]SHK32700.1 Protein of unknown function [[Clostridium] paradoxum JW-YL-7 = DSM 7308]